MRLENRFRYIGKAGPTRYPVEDLTKSYIGASSNSSTNVTSLTYNSVSIGSEPSASKDRYLVFCHVACDPAYEHANPISVTDVTVDGDSTKGNTIVSDYSSEFAIPFASVSIYGPINSGTTANVIISFDEVVDGVGCRLFTYQLLSTKNSPDFGIYQSNSSSSTNDPVANCDLDCPAGGVVIACCADVNGGFVTWSTLTEDVEIDVDVDDIVSCASAEYSTEQSALDINWSNDGNTSRTALAAVSFSR